MKIRRTKEDTVLDISVYLLLGIMLFLTLYPFYYILVQSINDAQDAMLGGIYFWPRKFTISNYQSFFTDWKWIRAFLVSLARTAIGTTLTVLFTSLFAYALSMKDLAYRKVYMGILVFSMYFSGGIIPNYVLLKQLNLINKFAVYVIPGMLSGFFVIVAITFFRGIPLELSESAKIDGANDLTIFLRIILPVSKPILATIGLFSAVGQWNNWFDSAFYIQKPELRTLSYLMMEVINKSQLPPNADPVAAAQMGTTQTAQSVQMTAMIISVLPIMCVYPFLQKYFVKGIMIGSVKG